MNWFLKNILIDGWIDGGLTKLLEMVQTIIKVLQRCRRELPWSQSRRWRDRSICKLWAACLHLWRLVCDFPRMAWGGTRHEDLHGNETVGWERPSKKTGWPECWFVQKPQNSPESWLQYAEIQFLRWSGRWCSVGRGHLLHQSGLRLCLDQIRHWNETQQGCAVEGTDN